MPERVEMEHQVENSCAGQRLDQVACMAFPEYSRARLQKWIREKALTIDGVPGRPSQKITGGEWLRLSAELEPEGVVVAQDIPIDVVHHDEHVLVLNKPAGLVVHPAAGHRDGTLQNGLLYYAPELDLIPRSGIVHRLDKDTSGVMVVACSLKSHASLVGQLQERQMSRVYEAVVHGQTMPAGTINAPVGRHPRDRKRMAVVANGKPAVSHFRRLDRFGHFTHLEVSLESGRTHQIRVHVQHLGHPMVGDTLYGRKLNQVKSLDQDVADAIRAFPRQALHARTLSLVHPGSGEHMSFTVPVPPDIDHLLTTIRAGDPS